MGGTLVISRELNNHTYFTRQLEGAGFPRVACTTLEKDGLNFLISDMKPNYLIMGARFYQCCTPFLLGQLHKTFPKIKMVAVSIGEYPADLAMYFVINGAGSYVSTSDGFDKVPDILAGISKGKEFISPDVLERIEMRRDYPEPAGKITERQREVIRLVCCGFTDVEIGDTLHVSTRTAAYHKTEIYTSLNVRNNIELIIIALTLNIVSLDELSFRPKDYTLNPLPENKTKNRGIV